MSELKPCPGCGETDRLVIVCPGVYLGRAVKCGGDEGCDWMGPCIASDQEHLAREGAVEAWNRRLADPSPETGTATVATDLDRLTELAWAWANEQVDEGWPPTTEAKKALIRWLLDRKKDPRGALLNALEAAAPAPEPVKPPATCDADSWEFCKRFPACQHTPGDSGYCSCCEPDPGTPVAGTAPKGGR